LIASQSAKHDDTKSDDHNEGDDHLEELHPCLLLESSDDLCSSVETVDEHLARPVLTCNTRRVFDRVGEFLEPLHVVAPAPKPPRAVLLLDDPKEVRHAAQCRPRQPEERRAKGPKVSVFLQD